MAESEALRSRRTNGTHTPGTVAAAIVECLKDDSLALLGVASSIRQVCRLCGESQISKVVGIPAAVTYAVVIDSCSDCTTRRRDPASVDEYVHRERRNAARK